MWRSSAAMFLLAVISTGAPAQAHAATYHEIWQMLVQGRYVELDATMSAYQQAYEKNFRTDDGAERVVSRAIRTFHVTDESIAPAIDAWVKQMPQSYMASLVRGRYLASIAWKRRTGKTSDKVTAEQWAAAREVAQRATEELERSTKLTERPTLSYAVLIEISPLYSGSQKREILLEKANRLDPNNYYPNSEYLALLRPQWYGSLPEMRDFVDAYRTVNPSKWKGDCLAAMLSDQENWGTTWNPTVQATDQAIKSATQAIELCPRWDRYSTRGAYYSSRGDIAAAEADFRKALELSPGTSYAQAQLGSILQHRGAFDEAFQVCAESARTGQAASMRCLSWAYLNGKGVQKDLGEGVAWLQKCAALDDAACKTDLANYYWHGLSVKQDKDHAMELWRAAAADGNTDAAAKLRSFGQESWFGSESTSRVLALLLGAIILGACFVLVRRSNQRS